MGSLRWQRSVWVALLAITAAACGGSGASGEACFNCPGGGGGGTGGGGDEVTPDIRLGSFGNGGAFSAGTIGVAVPLLASGGSSGLRVDIVDVNNNNALVTDPVSVTFSSSCLSSGLAEVDPNPATSVNGSVAVTYVARGCSGSDSLIARANVGGASLRADGSIEVLPAELGSIEFVSAEPINIGLRGSGQQETSTVRFRVRNSAGGPIANQAVRFELNTTLGGIQLEPVEGVTNTQGVVQTVVRSGTVSTAVRVTATAERDGVTITSQSEQLTITTGIPDQDSFSLSAECFNVEGLNRDGEIVPVTLRAADRYNNPVPDNTAVTFTTEGGAIQGSCVTQGGACTVNWVSQNPRPIAYNNCEAIFDQNTDAQCAVGGPRGAPRAGRSTVLAFAVGEESFIDADSDGLYDEGETFEDLAEAFLDVDGDGIRDAASPHTEVFFDFDRSGDFSPGDGSFTGLLCDRGTPGNIRCPAPTTLHVRDSLTIIMSGSNPVIDLDSEVFVSGGAYDPAAGTITISSNGGFGLTVVVRDVNDQPMPAGTDIAFTAQGSAGSIQGTSSYRVPCTVDDSAVGNAYGISFRGAEIDPGDPDGVSSLEFSVTSPAGLNTLYRFTVVTLAPRPGN